MKIVMFYEVTTESMQNAKTHFQAHLSRLHEFKARGELLMAGPFATTGAGAMGIFTNRSAAEEFIEGDPFVTCGVVSNWRLCEWNEVLA